MTYLGILRLFFLSCAVKGIISIIFKEMLTSQMSSHNSQSRPSRGTSRGHEVGWNSKLPGDRLDQTTGGITG